jgi:AAA+ superfamily predicted ATPase
MHKKKNSKEEYTSPTLLESQEHLSTDILSQFVINNYVDLSKLTARPPSNFIDLMNWVYTNFIFILNDKSNVNKFVHNRIIIDGQFLHFCKDKGIKVECLYKDSFISWKTDHDYEKFFVQGVFVIRSSDCEFVHAALFHKGNQNEDEVSFCVLVSQKNYENYLKIRNEFDAWVLERDRSNLNIRVVDGDDIPYTKDLTWDDLVLPENIKLEMKNLVEGFLASKEFYHKNKMPWKRGMLLYGKPGCGKSTIIKTIMSMYNFKPVTIIPGATDDLIREAFSYAEEQSPSLLYFEDLDSLLEKNDLSSFLNLMDGISAKNGLLVVATANEVKKLKPSITDRPSRFDRKFEIPLPSQEMAYIYIKKWFGNLVSTKKCRELSKYSEKYEFSYAYLKDLYISSMFEALSHNRKTPTEKDIDHALNRLVKEKNLLSNKSINTEKYFK